MQTFALNWRYYIRTPLAAKFFEGFLLRGPEEIDWEYSSGRIICEECECELHDHPHYPFEECLTITCEGKLVKL